MAKNYLLEYSKQLAIDIEKLCQSLENKKGVSNTVFQIRKSSSSVYANVNEGQYPQSLADMLSKFQIALKECNETEGWLSLLFETGFINEELFKQHRNLCGRVKRVLLSSCKTIKSKIGNK